jgi:hypothetical protein
VFVGFYSAEKESQPEEVLKRLLENYSKIISSRINVQIDAAAFLAC